MLISSSLILKMFRYLQHFCGGIFLLFILFIGINSWGVAIFQVEGHSMEPTYHDRQVLLVNLITYKVAVPKSGDIIVFSYAGDNSIRFIKRIKGVPGEEVMYQGETKVLQKDEYFVEGDNTFGSTDSRVYGPINKSQIIGKVITFNN